MSSLKVNMNYATFNTLKLHTNAHTVDGSPTLKDDERLWHWSALELYERSIYERKRRIPTFQFGSQKIPTYTFTKYLEFTKKKARVHADMGPVNYYSLKSRKIFCHYSPRFKRIIVSGHTKEVISTTPDINICTRKPSKVDLIDFPKREFTPAILFYLDYSLSTP